MRTASWTFLVCLVLGCGGKEGPPKAPLDREKFEQVLTESLLIEARARQELQLDKHAKDPVASEYDGMFRKQGVTEADFRATYEAYLKQPETLKSVYQDVLNDLQQRADSTAR